MHTKPKRTWLQKSALLATSAVLLVSLVQTQPRTTNDTILPLVQASGLTPALSAVAGTYNVAHLVPDEVGKNGGGGGASGGNVVGGGSGGGYGQPVSDPQTMTLLFPDDGLGGVAPIDAIMDPEKVDPGTSGKWGHTGWQGQIYACRWTYANPQVGREALSTFRATWINDPQTHPDYPPEFNRWHFLSKTVTPIMGSRVVSKDWFLSDPSPSAPPHDVYEWTGGEAPLQETVDGRTPSAPNGTIRTLYERFELEKAPGDAWKPIPSDPYEIGRSHNSTDSHKSYSAADLQNELNAAFGVPPTDMAIFLNASFNYDGSSPVPDSAKSSAGMGAQAGVNGEDHFAAVNGNRETGKYAIDIVDDRGGTGDCTQNEFKALYYNNDFYVTSNFTLNHDYNMQHFATPGMQIGPRPKPTSQGNVYWELARNGSDGEADIRFHTNISGSGEHLAVRNAKLTVTAGDYTCNVSGGSNNAMSCDETRANASNYKGQTMTYTYSYEYTNKEVGYKCTGTSCDYSGEPDWRAVELYSQSGSLPINIKSFETFSGNDMDSAVNKRLLVGREHILAGEGEYASYSFHETFARHATNDVKTEFYFNTQGHTPLRQGALAYSVHVPSSTNESPSYHPFRTSLAYGDFLTRDIDDNLKETYKKEDKYSIPIQQHVFDSEGLSGNNMHNYKVDFISDVFVVAENTGYIQSAPYAKMIKDNRATPVQTAVDDAITNIKRNYKNQFGVELIDTFITGDAYTQEYYMPISNETVYKPKTTYNNVITYHNMGLNDVTFKFNQTFEFGHFLVGNAKDDAWIVEQVDTRATLQGKEISPTTITITDANLQKIIDQALLRPEERVHNVRHIDRQNTYTPFITTP